MVNQNILERSEGGQLKFIGSYAFFIVTLCVTFNFILAIINTHFIKLGTTSVIICELLIILASHILILKNMKEEIISIYWIIFIFVLIFLMRYFFSGNLDLKSLRDAIVAPTFFALGIACGIKTVRPTIYAVHIIVVFFAIFEVSLPSTYSAMVNVKEYYINTRGLAPESFWNQESTLFVSSSRPGERNLLPFLDIHRVSSVFLEPVSLGNYCIILAAFILSFKKHYTIAIYFLFIVSILFLLIACDGRLALVTIVIIFITSNVRPILRNSTLILLPLAIVTSILVLIIFNPQMNTDSFLSRITLLAVLLSKFGPFEYLGISNLKWILNADSGITYFIATQSIIGVIIFWSFFVLYTKERFIDETVFKRSILFFLVFTMIISNSFVSIKTSALLWLVLGALQTRHSGERI